MAGDGARDFEIKLRFRYNEHWVPRNFEWDLAPACCQNLIDAFKANALFVRDWSYGADGDHVQAYLLDADGELLSEKGVQLIYCPWCGTKIKVVKKQQTSTP